MVRLSPGITIRIAIEGSTKRFDMKEAFSVFVTRFTSLIRQVITSGRVL